MGEGMVVALAAAGVAEVVVANRTVERGARLAARVGGRAVGFERLSHELEQADLLLASTGAGSVVVEHDVVAAVMAARPHRPLLVVDVGVPRDVDPAVAGVAGVTCLDLDDLRDWVARGLAERRAEAEAVRLIVADEVDRFVDLATARQVAPLVASLHDRAEQLRASELDRFRARLDGLDERQREAVEALTRGLVAKLLHEPSVRLKEQAGTPRGERNASALRDLFDLDS
jgi:glutamyl-tRNA reductase